MVGPETDALNASDALPSPEYPLKSTAAMLNDRLGLYLSDEQQRGFAAGLLIGTAIGAAVLSWSITGMVLRKR
jgi:hypothetical protein